MSAKAPSPHIVICTKPSHAGRPYLQGPLDPWYVRRFGYVFTSERYKAWPFASEAQAKRKASIVNTHIGWTAAGVNHMAVKPAEYTHPRKPQPTTY